ncbi:MAG TPA: NHLP bacteriocin export ABC transporter permease/ATPase subunit [Chloroflexota bacterium]|jgi:ATP-binding cassette subfamily C protein
MVEVSRPRADPAEATLAMGANAPLLLDDPASAWLVEVGEVLVFAVEMAGNTVVGPRRYLFSARPGDVLFGMDLSDPQPRLGYLAVGLADTRVRRVATASLQADALDPTAAVQLRPALERWVASLSTSLTDDAAPAVDCVLDAQAPVALTDGKTARPAQGVLWVQVESGDVHFLDCAARVPLGTPFPVAASAWVRAASPCHLTVAQTAQACARPDVWAGLAAFHAAARACQRQRLDAAAAADATRLQGAAAYEEATHEQAAAALTAVLDSHPRTASAPLAASPLLAACTVVGQALGVTIRGPRHGADETGRDALAAIADASRLRMRRVTLDGPWWRQEIGPLLGYLAESQQPVALVPAGRAYDLVDPVAGTRARVDQTTAARLTPTAHMFYRPLPAAAPSVWALLRFGLRDCSGDLLVVGLLGVAVGLLGLALPVGTGILFDTVIPRAERSQLAQVGAALLVSTLALGLFTLTRNFALLRLETRISGALQAAVWDRLLRLPAPFFRHYSAGDLALRAMAIESIRQTLSAATVSVLLASAFSLVSFPLLFYYDLRLGLLAVLLAAITFGVAGLASYWQLRYQRPLAALQGKLSGLVFQFMIGIPKLHVAAAEGRAFAAWAEGFAAQKRLGVQAQSVANLVVVFESAWPIVATMAIFAVIAYGPGGTLATGAFLGFSVAFAQFLMAALTMAVTLGAVLNVIPLYERVQPILRAPLEVTAAKAAPGVLRGAIELSHVAFRYQADRPLVLEDVSLTVGPGEFVALVGPSGAGKSSLFRLLLGFETPEAGAIYFDGQDLAGLDLEAVRHQIGVVLQNGKVQPGTIFENIVGAGVYTLDDAWEAARQAGLEAQIKQLPMGMQTFISEGGATFSGGQRQLLLIARALVRKPRILLFDEATSALDNETQAIVTASLKALHATRIVIAHRLTTVEQADRLYVLSGGQIVQSGKYADLLKTPGPFADLAHRQLA